MRILKASAVLAALFLSSPVAAQVGVQLVTADLEQPLFLTSPPGDPRLFILEKTGEIRVFANGQLLREPFLDLSDEVATGPEQGLLGLAFHPNYASNGRFFVNYTDEASRTQIVEYQVSNDPNRAASNTGRPIVTIQRPGWRHNGGWMAFGPDGLLYVTSGDGGGTNDPDGNGQNPNSLFGKIFRLNVDNPGAIEIVAWGLRNPWRAAFDGNTIWLGDVGQDGWEEINRFTLAEAPVNFGWVVMEGAECYRDLPCDPSLYTPPVYAYSHNDGCSVTGGYVYRGAAVPALRGHYLFADWCSGWVRSISENGEVVDWTPWLGDLGNVTSFGVDAFGEMYIVAAGSGRLIQQGGAIYKIVAQ
jgi:glucose/arabinose dehydrogenase